MLANSCPLDIQQKTTIFVAVRCSIRYKYISAAFVSSEHFLKWLENTNFEELVKVKGRKDDNMTRSEIVNSDKPLEQNLI